MQTLRLLRLCCWLVTTAIFFKVVIPFSLYMYLNQQLQEQQHRAMEIAVKLKQKSVVIPPVMDFDGQSVPVAAAVVDTSVPVSAAATATKKQKNMEEEEEEEEEKMLRVTLTTPADFLAAKKEMLATTLSTTRLQLPPRPSSNSNGNSNSSSLPVTKKRQELDGLSTAANRFKIAYPTIARAELLAFQVPLQPPEDENGRVKVVEEYSQAAFVREILHGVPVVFKNFFQNPRTIDALHVRDTVGFMEIYVKTGNYGDPMYGGKDAHFHAHTQYATTMGEYIDTVILGGETHDGVIPYAGNIVCDHTCEELLLGRGNAIQFPFYEKMRPTAKFWVSKTGTLTPLHRDTADNLIVQLHGRKQWTLFPIRKDVADRLYYNPSPINGVGSERSLVNISNPESWEQFPAYDEAFRQAYSYTATVDAGDLLFLPVGWGHEVSTVTDSVMLNYWVSKPKSIYEHVVYTLNGGRDDDDNDILDMVYSLDNVASMKDASVMLPVSGLKLRGPRSEDEDDYEGNGVTLKFHQPVTEQFTMIFDVQLPPGTTGHLALKRNAVNKKVYWSLQLVDCFTLHLNYSTGTAAAATTASRKVRKTATTATTSSGSSSSSSISWQTQETMCNDEKHRIIASVDHNHVTFTMDQDTSGAMSLDGTIRDCAASVSSCTLQAGALTLPAGTEGLLPLAFVYRKKAL